MHAAALRYIDAVARFGSIRRAAENLYVSASAINRQVIQLEELLGAELFERRATGMKPTEVGLIVIEHARQTLNAYEVVKGEIAHIRGHLTGSLRIATLDSLTVHILPRAIIGFRRLHPDVTFQIETADPAGVSRLVGNDSADLGLTFNSQTHRGMRVLNTVPANLCAIVHKNHPLAGREELSVFDCGETDIILQEDSGPVGDVLGQEIELFKQSARPILVTDTIIASKAMILQGAGVGLFTRFGFVEEIAAGTVRAIPLTERRPSTLALTTIVSSARKPTRSVEAFADHLSAILVAESPLPGPPK